MTELIRYDVACRAIAEASAIDEVKDIRDKSEALRLYARQAKNRSAEVQMAEIRFRAERRIGDLKRAMAEAGLLHQGGRPKKTSDSETEVSERSVRLIDLGIDDSLARRADALASIEPNSFDRLVARWRAHQEAATDKVSLNLLKEDRDAERKREHQARTYEGGKVEDLHKLIASGYRAKAILMDPPWHFMTRSQKGEGRSAGVHYTTGTGDEIAQLPVAQLADENCVLFMWMVDWCPQLALDLIEGWGFEHKTTAFTWVKQLAAGGPDFHMGQGFWTRANPEACWLATKGKPKRIHADVRQLIVAPVMEHSRKPDIVHERIERLVDGPYLELYARRPRDGWKYWGNEVPFKLDTGELADPNTGEILDDATEPAASSTEAPAAREQEPLDIPAFLRRGPGNTFPVSA